MQSSFGKVFGDRLRAEHRPVLFARVLRHPEVAVTEVRSEHPTHEQSDPLPYDDAFGAALQLRDFPRHAWWEDGRAAPLGALRAGHLTLYDLARDPRFLINAPFHSIHFHLSRTLLEAVANESGASFQGELAYPAGVGVDDPVFRHLTLALQPAFANPEHASRLFVDSVTLAVAAHVVRTYGGAYPRRARKAGGLSPRQQRRAFELIDARLGGDLSISEIASHCGLSSSHFTQGFKTSVGMTPHRWLTTRRIDKSKGLLRESKLSLGHIALECGFANQSHFTRVFTSIVGSPPGAWRKQ